MRALTWQGNEHVEVTDVPDPVLLRLLQLCWPPAQARMDIGAAGPDSIRAEGTRPGLTRRGDPVAADAGGTVPGIAHDHQRPDQL